MNVVRETDLRAIGLEPPVPDDRVRLGLVPRLGRRRWAAAAAVLLFAASPLAVPYHRMVLLDNLAVPWLLAAFGLALSPQRRLWAAAGSGLCFAAAVLSKETVLVLLPIL